jgi:stalled ribosome rescue protein Dom34
MTPIDADDLWFVYNLIAHGDYVMAVTVRYSFYKKLSSFKFSFKSFLISYKVKHNCYK